MVPKSEFSEPIFAEFTRKTGIAVLAKYDVESTKTVGLAEAIRQERRMRKTRRRDGPDAYFFQMRRFAAALEGSRA